MNQQDLRRKRGFVLIVLLGAVLAGLVWYASTSPGVLAGDTLLLETSYKDAAPRKVAPGGTVLYSIVLNNSDLVSDTQGITVFDPLDEKLSFVIGTAAVTPYTAGYNVPLATGVRFVVYPMAPGASVTLTFQATLTTTVVTGEVITNTATITEGMDVFTRFVTVTVDDYPTAQINVPWNNQLITTRSALDISGRTWHGEHPDFPEPPVISSIVNGGGVNDWYLVQWSAVPGAISYVLQESTDVYFSTITDEIDLGGGTTSQNFSSQPRGFTYYYRLKARTLVYESRWSAAESVTVNSTAMIYEPQTAAPLAVPSSVGTLVDPPTVEINIKKVGSVALDNWLPITTIAPDPVGGEWWNWTYVWTPPMEDDAQYLIQARAKGPSGTYDPEKIDTITVTLRNGIRYVYLPMIYKRYPPVPYAPTLKVDSNNTYGTYQLSWTYDYVGDAFAPTSYRLQEATDANFANLTLDQITASPRSFANKAVGTYYYRVRGINAYGEGVWSNVIAIVVNQLGFFDDFSNVASGWPRAVYWRGTDPVDGPVFDVNYENGSYRAKIMLNTDSWNNRRMGPVKSPYVNPFSSYDIEVDHRFAKAGDQVVPPDAGKGGLIFGANGDYSVIYVVEWNFEGDCAVSKYKKVVFPTTIINFDNITYLKGWGRCNAVKVGYDQHNLVKVTVTGNQAAVYINGAHIGTYTDADIQSYHNVGLMTGSWDRTPVESRFDNFRISPR